MILLYVIAYLWAFWAAYVLVMGLYRAHLDRRLHGVNFVMAVPALALAYAMDVFANMTIAPFVFLDLPREWLVTDRLIRYKSEAAGWRAKLATAICEGILDVFDPTGDHC